ncbi:hypothetical protein PTH_2240 [Pelotomaculum thermopropionicum SI]|uniref:Uncharacterized protein n=1 Tax=Pelotomaculum thermopropionicum (strain DSM 13744 / JCM 10971 / SI) TaxID=370438 RepID=A5CZZ7_PELTS|nr:hypothetical protein PTH_2240 [Pelotomaculum thermopropionicum SI]
MSTKRLKPPRKGYTPNREGKEMKPEVTVVYDTDDSRLRDAFRLLADFFEQAQAGQRMEAGGGDR